MLESGEFASQKLTLNDEHWFWGKSHSLKRVDRCSYVHGVTGGGKVGPQRYIQEQVCQDLRALPYLVKGSLRMELSLVDIFLHYLGGP